MVMAVIRYIGIDFGTSTTVVRFKDYKEGEKTELSPPNAICEPSTGETRIKTLVFVPESDEYPVVYGNEALYQNNKGKLYSSFKMLLESEDQNEVDPAVSLIGGFLKWIRKIYVEQKDNFAACDTEKTYISYPVKWSDKAMKIMERLTRDAGFKNVEGINEPMAAIHGILINHIKEFQTRRIVKPDLPFNTLLIDMGAGTTDLVLFKTILHENDVSVDIITTWPPADYEITFGGREVESILCDTMLRELIPNNEEKRKRRFPAFLRHFKKWKELNLSPALNSKEVQAPPACISEFMDILDMDPSEIASIDRSRFEQIMGGYLEQFPKLINDCLAYSAGQKDGIKSNDDIDLVIITGGHSQWYFVEEMLLHQMISPKGQEIILPKLMREDLRLIHTRFPQETVANGMAYKGFPLNIKTVAANSVWFSLKIGSMQLEPVQLVEKDTVLPAKNKMVFYKTIKAEFSTDSNAPNGLHNKYAIPCSSEMLVGEMLETAKIHKMDLKVENDTFANMFSDLIATLKSKDAFHKEYFSTITISIETGEQQNITLDGQIAFSNSKKLNFTY
jgi:molecular chaperone DnaK (HSP70)